VAEHLPSKWEALNSNPSTTKKWKIILAWALGLTFLRANLGMNGQNGTSLSNLWFPFQGCAAFCIMFISIHLSFYKTKKKKKTNAQLSPLAISIWTKSLAEEKFRKIGKLIWIHPSSTWC
jgi:hypothetical protein